MKRLLILIICITASALAFAATYTAESLPVSTHYKDSLDFNGVSNPDGILSSADVKQINQMLWSLRCNQGVQGLVVVVEETDPEETYDFAMEVGKKYGVGGKQSLGFVMVVSTELHSYTIITGSGLEKFLTDAHCSWIERNIMVKHFKEDEFGKGVTEAVRTIQGICSGEVELTAEDLEDDDFDWSLLWYIVPAGLIFTGWAAETIDEHRRKKCPKCKKHKLEHKERNVQALDADGIPMEVVEKYDNEATRYFVNPVTEEKFEGHLSVKVTDTYVCSACGHTCEKETLSTTKRYHIGKFTGKRGRLWGEIGVISSGGSGSSDSSSSDSSNHDTYGGGDFSGGGASGKW